VNLAFVPLSFYDFVLSDGISDELDNQQDVGKPSFDMVRSLRKVACVFRRSIFEDELDLVVAVSHA
jgi:hypothetical protein